MGLLGLLCIDLFCASKVSLGFCAMNEYPIRPKWFDVEIRKLAPKPATLSELCHTGQYG